MIKISFGCTRDFRVKIWETLLPEDKLAGDLGNVIEATSIRRLSVSFFEAGKLAPGNLGLFQQHRPEADISRFSVFDAETMKGRLRLRPLAIRERPRARRAPFWDRHGPALVRPHLRQES